MKVYETQNIRNLAFVGHAATGKTTLAESILFNTGAINRQGTVEEKNTVSDNNEIEHERSHSVLGTPLYTEYNNLKINIIDAPGYYDYFGEVAATISVVDTAMITINSQNGIEVGAENAWTQTVKTNTPVCFIINKVDLEQSHFENTYNDIRDSYGKSAVLVQYPLAEGANFKAVVDVLNMKLVDYSSGKPELKDIPESEKSKVTAYRSDLVEAVAETEEELMNKYFEEGDLSVEDIKKGLKKAIIERQIFPIFATSGKSGVGVSKLIDFICDYIPSPADMPGMLTVNGDYVKYNTADKPSLFVFKLLSEAHLGDMTYFKVVSGKVTPGMDLINEQKSAAERFNQIFVVNGKKRAEVEFLNAGDIGSTVKLKGTGINHTLHEKGKNVEFAPIEFPNPIVRVSIVPKTKGEEEKVGMGMNALCQEDLSLKLVHSQELRQMIIFGMGELHLSATRWRLEHRYKVETEFIEPRVPYRETIQKQVRGSYRHRKQSGGAGQFAEVHMLVDPWYENMPNPEGITVRGKDLIDLEWGGKLEYVNSIVGGVIDQRFMPAILKGVMDKMHIGPLTGSYVRDIRVCIFDGKMHPVDSNEAAFKTAGMMVFKEIFVQASPKILEPVYEVVIKTPDEFIGDVMSDLPTRRGVILGIDTEGKYQKVKARMPLAELDKYAAGLRSMTQARATYTAEFIEYQAVPPNVQQQLMDAYKKQQTDED
jgi:elongation factor G